MRRYFRKGSMLASAVYLLIFFNWQDWFGQTPVNLLGLGGPWGGSNLMINLFAYGIVTCALITPFALLFKEKKEWMLQSITGINITAVLGFFYIVIALYISKHG